MTCGTKCFLLLPKMSQVEVLRTPKKREARTYEYHFKLTKTHIKPKSKNENQIKTILIEIGFLPSYDTEDIVLTFTLLLIFFFKCVCAYANV